MFLPKDFHVSQKICRLFQSHTHDNIFLTGIYFKTYLAIYLNIPSQGNDVTVQKVDI